jgi:hypothetical protein
MHEQARRAQVGKMLNPELLGLRGGCNGYESSRQASKPAPVRRRRASSPGGHRRNARRENSPATLFAQNPNRVAQPGAIPFRISRKRRPAPPLLAEGQIAAQNEIAMSGETFAEATSRGALQSSPHRESAGEHRRSGGGECRKPRTAGCNESSENELQDAIRERLFPVSPARSNPIAFRHRMQPHEIRSARSQLRPRHQPEHVPCVKQSFRQ